MSWPWSQLGLPGPSELSEVRHAYAEKLKVTHPEEDPEGFQRLHSAYQLASRMARQKKRQAEVPPPEPPKPQPQAGPPAQEEDFDFDRLLQDQEGREPPRRPPEEAEDFDFDELLREDDTPPRPPEEEEQDFDFERLFAEGEAERAEARRRRAEERRRAEAQAQAWRRERQKAKEWARKREHWQRQEERNTGDRERQDRFRQEQDRWENTEAILHSIEMMYNARAEAEVWQKFFTGPLFQQTKGSLDLIFGLEDFVSTRSLSQEVRLALFMAYGFDKGASRPELQPLYQMLLPAWRAARSEKTHERNLAILGVVLGMTAPFILVPLLDMGLIPALFISLGVVWVVWVVRKAIKTGNLERRARGQNVRQERRTIVLAAIGVVALIAVMSWARTRPQLDLRSLLPTKDPRELTCRYIRQDFGIEVESLYKQYPLEDNSNIFQLKSDISKSFLAGPDGERKGANTGYTTNLPEMMLFWALKDFSLAHKMSPVNALDQGLGREQVSGLFLITLPEEGGEEIIDELGALLEELHEEKWYKALPARCELVVCSREMNEGRIVLIRVHPATEVYSAAQIRGLYEDGFAHAVYAQIIRELELDRDFLREEGARYTLTNEGMAPMRGNECYKLFGLDETGAVAMEYYVYPKLRNIYCFPGNFWETGNSEEQTGFYRLLHWGNRGTFNLFYPWLKTG